MRALTPFIHDASSPYRLFADLSWQTGQTSLDLSWRITPLSPLIVFPPKSVMTRRDQLWERTCFEAFIESPDGGYDEINLNPAGEWNFFHFTSYRSERSFPDVLPPGVRIESSKSGMTIVSHWKMPHPLPMSARINLSAVIAQTDGQKTYWALSHPETTPNFHRLEQVFAAS